MNCSVRAYTAAEVPAMVEIWNEVVRDGIAYPQENELDLAAGTDFLLSPSGLRVLSRNDIERSPFHSDSM